MDIRYKILLSTGSIWFAFLATSFFFIKDLTFIALGILFFLILYTLLLTLIKNEIAALNTQINHSVKKLNELEEKLNHRMEDAINPSYLQPRLPKSTDHLKKLTHYDNLTTLPNQVFFNEMLNKTLNHAIRHHKILAILFIDLDSFKKINDEFGFNTGNAILKDIASRFKNVLRNDDIIARLYGDEFIILLNDISSPKFASSIAEKILNVCSTQPILVQNQKLFITASIGICTFPHDGDCLEDLQKHADLALFKAKFRGGSNYQYFNKEMTLTAHKNIHIETALRKALTQNEFVLHFQPKLNLSQGMITSVEALIRWVDPTIGIINPLDFIQEAEETGLMLQIGEWVLHEACRANKSWQLQGLPPISISVNLSPKQFAHPEIVNIIQKVLTETKLNPEYLELEITEKTIMDDVKVTLVKLEAIKKLGIKISIDDFGTGYTSISYLKKFPIDIIKIDQSFIKHIPTNQNDLAITIAIVALCHNLGIQVVAEGVETAEQLHYLAEHGCDFIQGYYFSRPVLESKIPLLLSSEEW